MTDASHDRLDVPSEGLTFVSPMRAHHLSGGLSMVVASNRLAMMFPSDIGPTLFSFSSKHSVAACLKGQEGIRHLGSNYFKSAEEMNAAVTSNFTISVASANGDCLATTQSHEWSGIANTLHQSNQGADALIANRVASQLRSCLSRLERHSMAYRTVLLEVRGREAPPSPSSFTNDKYASYLGIEYRAMLNELYGLRDAILAATYRFKFQSSEVFTMRRMKALVLPETVGAAGLISSSMFSTTGDLLIDHMALYRSLAQHCLGASNPIFGDVYQLRHSSGLYGDFLYVVYPLYDNIEAMRAIEQGASKGVLERPPIEEVKRFATLGKYRDGLEFCNDCFVRLLKIAELLRQEIDIQSQPITITDREILDITLTDEAGNVTRKKRDEMGRLVDY